MLIHSRIIEVKSIKLSGTHAIIYFKNETDDNKTTITSRQYKKY